MALQAAELIAIRDTITGKKTMEQAMSENTTDTSLHQNEIRNSVWISSSHILKRD
jgi:hypothetical protein